VVHAAASSPNGVDHRLRRNLFTIDSLPHQFRLGVYENSSSAGLRSLGMAQGFGGSYFLTVRD
jgi:hypothetical protein